MPCNAAAVFTQNKFAAAPVQVSRQALQATQGTNIYGVVTNSGCANAVTGSKGMANAQRMGQTFTKALGIATVEGETGQEAPVLVMSTGVIGQQLPMDKLEKGITQAAEQLGRSHNHWLQYGNAYMTTDTFPKLRSKPFQLPSGTEYRMAGVTKGAGMIHPNMATLLGTIATDLDVSSPCLQAALKYAVDRSFNAITIDGDTSTNDTIAILANGQTNGSNGTPKISDPASPDFVAFQNHLTTFAKDLAQLVVRDGEGATKFITVRVQGAENFTEAKRIATTIATSSLVKTAIYGQDANWGRIACAIGYTEGVQVDTDRIRLTMLPMDQSEPLPLMSKGEPIPVDEGRASEILKMTDIAIEVDLGLGDATAEMYTCDLSHDYITINADYRS
ncbi:glutamate N-acetyltransferase [Dispira simplex]|nr:glutamate N-acetyltransferase [Dispira simplex]